jgi:hypothetical protein
MVKKMSLTTLLLSSLVLCVIFAYWAFMEKKKKDPKLTLYKFFNLDAFSSAQGWKSFIVGMIGGVIFGFIDNAGLWLGMDALEPPLKRMGVSGNSLSGWGNTFSDGLGAFLGTFIGIIVSERSGVDVNDTPILANFFGVIIGCILGIKFGELISSKRFRKMMS